VFTAQKVKPLMIKETANVAAAISRVWSVNSDHQCAILLEWVFTSQTRGFTIFNREITNNSLKKITNPFY
jgi:hypothetical protein